MAAYQRGELTPHSSWTSSHRPGIPNVLFRFETVRRTHRRLLLLWLILSAPWLAWRIWLLLPVYHCFPANKVSTAACYFAGQTAPGLGDWLLWYVWFPVVLLGEPLIVVGTVLIVTAVGWRVTFGSRGRSRSDDQTPAAYESKIAP
jgi:hypothetical protein